MCHSMFQSGPLPGQQDPMLSLSDQARIALALQLRGYGSYKEPTNSNLFIDMLGYLTLSSSKMLPFILVKLKWGGTEMSRSGQTWTYCETTGLLETRAERTIKRRLYWLIPKEFPLRASVDWMKLLKPFRGRGVNGTFAQSSVQTQFDSSVHSQGGYISLALQEFLSNNFKLISS